MEFNIEEYLDSLPETIEEINISNTKITYIPSLSRFTNLKKLNCSYNKLTQLPELPFTLTHLYCYYNKLTVLPKLPSILTDLRCYTNNISYLQEFPPTLTCLDCDNNKLLYLPELPSTLNALICYNNQLTLLPELPSTLKYLYSTHNPFIEYFDSTLYSNNKIIHHSKIISHFRHLYYSLCFHKQFRDWLYIRVREPNAKKRFHPKYLLHNLTEDADLEEVLANWN